MARSKENKINFNYDLLIELINNKYKENMNKNIALLASESKITRFKLELALENKVVFDQEDIYYIKNVLNIPDEEIVKYFFTKK